MESAELNEILFCSTYHTFGPFLPKFTLSIPGHAHRMQWHQLVRNSVCLQTKINLIPQFFFFLRDFTL